MGFGSSVTWIISVRIGPRRPTSIYPAGSCRGNGGPPWSLFMAEGGPVATRRRRELNIGTNLVRNGYVGMSINYVLSTKKQPTWPRNLQDCKTAVRWLRQNAERLQVDPDHIGVIGGSAGGHLAAMVGVTGPEDGLDPDGPKDQASCRVQCAVDLYGPADLLEYHDVSMLGKSREEAPDLYREASPTHYADQNDPPLLILHGTADKTVALKQSELLAAALKKAGTVHELVVVPDAPHTFHLQPKQRDLRPLVIGFFDKYLKSSADAK